MGDRDNPTNTDQLNSLHITRGESDSNLRLLFHKGNEDWLTERKPTLSVYQEKVTHFQKPYNSLSD